MKAVKFLVVLALLLAAPAYAVAKDVVKDQAKEVKATIKAMPDGDRAELLELLNEGSAKDLMVYPGIGKASAKLIMAARPFKKVAHLLTVKGFTPAKVMGIVLFASASDTVRAMRAKNRTALLELLNEGKAKDLIVLPGIGEGMAKKIMAARPFRCVDDLTRVAGISNKKLDDIVKFADGGKDEAKAPTKR